MLVLRYHDIEPFFLMPVGFQIFPGMENARKVGWPMRINLTAIAPDLWQKRSIAARTSTTHSGIFPPIVANAARP
jgi:hypothetical protein